MDQLLKKIEAFMRRHDLEPTGFGVGATNDSGLVFDLHKGRKLRRKTIRKITKFMDEYQPPKE